jgi:hypothetical protein
LKGLTGIQLSQKQQQEKGTTLQFSSQQPVKVVVGFFQSKEKGYLQEPGLETDASADDYGQAAVRIARAVQLPGRPPVNIHTYYFPAGSHTLVLGKGACLVLGFMDGRQEVTVTAPLEELFN